MSCCGNCPQISNLGRVGLELLLPPESSWDASSFKVLDPRTLQANLSICTGVGHSRSGRKLI